jgi:phosphatidylglycerol---prolipoprotein diacylglyceryl transferase
MVPYFPQPEIHLFGRITLHAFGPLVALAVVVGWMMTVARCRKVGLSPTACTDLLAYVILSGFVVAHLSSVLAYFPAEAARNPVLLLRFWENISSFGGMIGGVFGLWLYFRRKGKNIGATDPIRTLDAIAYVFPFAWAIGRLGCVMAHDHPGTVTSFPLAVSLATRASRTYITYFYRVAGRLEELPDTEQLSRMGFHDQGWYEFLYTLLIIVPAFLVLDRKPRQPGFFSIAFLLLYIPARFLLDFLRLADARYAGLTPGQYAGAAIFLAVSSFAVRGGFHLGGRPPTGSS